MLYNIFENMRCEQPGLFVYCFHSQQHLLWGSSWRYAKTTYYIIMPAPLWWAVGQWEWL